MIPPFSHLQFIKALLGKSRQSTVVSEKSGTCLDMPRQSPYILGVLIDGAL
jgi:hypothetical protein